MKLFEEVAAKGAISAEDAFTLTATYGFPIELTEELARERGHAVDEDEFKRLMAEHREISRAGRRGASCSELRTSRARPASRPSSSATRRPRC